MLQPRDPKPPEVVHFDTVKEVMDALRGQHPALTASLEAFLTDIGALVAPHLGFRAARVPGCCCCCLLQAPGC